MTRPKKNLDPGYRRGNTTSGPSRRGNRNGRPAAYPPGTVVHHAMVTLADPDYAIAVIIGQGNVSRGVRAALAMASSQVPSDAPTTRFEAMLYIEKAKKAAHLSRLKERMVSATDNDTTWLDQ